MFKNIARFYKNPVGYTYWKVSPFHKQNRIRVMWALMFYHLYCSFALTYLVKTKKERMVGHWRYRCGEVNTMHRQNVRDRRFPADRKKNYLRYSNFH